MSNPVALYRHGDVFIGKIKKIPKDARALNHVRLAEGEITGHSHQVLQRGAAVLYQGSEDRFLDILADTATLTHEEHGPIDLPNGVYRVWIQREYFPEEIRRVID